MIKSFADVVKELSQYIPHPGKNVQASGGLDRMQMFMQRLGDPQNTYPIIHIGGTSGKGSTAIFTAALLSQCYPHVGLHTSPNLVSVNERMQINGKEITEEAFVSLARQILPVVEQIQTGIYGPPTYFEILTAMTLLYFAQQQVDVAVIEVGLGGRLDATNIVSSVVAVLTNVGLDHTDILGDTVEQIATDKVGIIKPGNNVVTGVTQPTVQTIVQAACSTAKASLSQMGRDFHYHIKSVQETGSVFSYAGYETYDSLFLAALGTYQPGNAALALRAVEAFQSMKKKPPLTGPTIERAWKRLIIPGRMEMLNRQPVVVLDGAHNPDKMIALGKSVQALFPHRRIVTVLAIKRGKDADAMVQQVATWSQQIIATAFAVSYEAGMMESYPPEELATMIRRLCPKTTGIVVPEVGAALAHAQSLAAPDDIILVTGSLYLIGEIKKMKNDKLKMKNVKHV